MKSDASERRSNVIALALFALISVLIGADLVADYAEGTSSGHVMVEASAVALALIGAVGFARRALALAREKRRLQEKAQALEGEAENLRDEADQLRDRLAASSADAERWRQEAKELVSGLASAIDRQFERWQLSPAEREVGLLLLKGLSHQEVADLRGVSERTVRQQARSLYKKAGLSGRADLSAYFLEDLLVLGPKR